jgi:tetratricopeptide (TPR) repeat protein
MTARATCFTHRIPSLVICAALSTSPIAVRAEDSALGSSPYLALIDHAIAEFDAHHFEEARALFLRAHRMAPSARTERGLGLAEFELRNYPEAFERFGAALSASVRPLEGELRRDTEQMRERARGFFAEVKIDSHPATAQVAIDGAPQTARQFPLTTGAHELLLEAPLHRAERRRIEVRGGEELLLTIALRAEPGEVNAERDEPTRRWYRSPWLWGTAGALALGAAGAAFALTRHPDTESESASGGSTGIKITGPAQ